MRNMPRGPSDAVKMYFRNAKRVFQAIPGIEWVKPHRYRLRQGYIYVDMHLWEVEIIDGPGSQWARLVPKETVE